MKKIFTSLALLSGVLIPTLTSVNNSAHSNLQNPYDDFGAINNFYTDSSSTNYVTAEKGIYKWTATSKTKVASNDLTNVTSYLHIQSMSYAITQDPTTKEKKLWYVSDSLVLSPWNDISAKSDYKYKDWTLLSQKINVTNNASLSFFYLTYGQFNGNTLTNIAVVKVINDISSTEDTVTFQDKNWYSFEAPASKLDSNLQNKQNIDNVQYVKFFLNEEYFLLSTKTSTVSFTTKNDKDFNHTIEWKKASVNFLNNLSGWDASVDYVRALGYQNKVTTNTDKFANIDTSEGANHHIYLFGFITTNWNTPESASSNYWIYDLTSQKSVVENQSFGQNKLINNIQSGTDDRFIVSTYTPNNFVDSPISPYSQWVAKQGFYYYDVNNVLVGNNLLTTDINNFNFSGSTITYVQNFRNATNVINNYSALTTNYTPNFIPANNQDSYLGLALGLGLGIGLPILFAISGFWGYRYYKNKQLTKK